MEFQRNFLGNHGSTLSKEEKINLDLNKKERYVIHCRLLQYYLKQGIKITKVHRVISCHEDNWLGKYIEQSTNQRIKSKTNFESELWKLMNNSFYWKTLENIKTEHTSLYMLIMKEHKNQFQNQTKRTQRKSYRNISQY